MDYKKYQAQAGNITVNGIWNWEDSRHGLLS